MNQGFLIPVYNHGATAGSVVARLLKQRDLPVILVDDGSDEKTKEQLAGVIAAYPQAVLVSLPKNQGKGGAVSAGIDRAHELGLSHVFQVDADGQHDLERAAFFLDQSALHPEAAICGAPVFDESIPPSRKKGRKIANDWVAIVTLSRVISDAMCGFRVYPVEPLWRIIHRHHCDQRMGFDIEILVRYYWQARGGGLNFHPVRVVYPKDGISNYHLVRDNIRIFWVFFRLFFGMLLRIPALLRKRRTP